MAASGGGDVIGRAVVEVAGDTSALDAALSSLPNKVKSKIDRARSSIGADIARLNLQIKQAMEEIASGATDSPIAVANVQKLIDAKGRLEAKLVSVGNAARNYAVRQDEVAQASLRAALASRSQGEAVEKLAGRSGGGLFTPKVPAPGAGGGGGGMGAMRMLLVGQFMDDLQYGLKSVVNNIPQLVMAFGGSAGLAGVIGIVAVAVNQLMNNWDKLAGMFGDTSAQERAMESLKGLTKHLDEIKEKLASGQTLTSGDLADLVTGGPRAKTMERAEAGAKAGEGPTEAEKEQGAYVVKAVTEAGGTGKLAEKIAGRMGDEELMGFLNASERRRARFASEAVAAGKFSSDENRAIFEQRQAALFGTARERAKEAVGNQIGLANSGDNAALEAVLKRSPELKQALREADADEELKAADESLKKKNAAVAREEAENDRLFEEQRRVRAAEWEAGQERMARAKEEERAAEDVGMKDLMEKQEARPKLEDELALKEAQYRQSASRVGRGGDVAQFEALQGFMHNFVGFGQRADQKNKLEDIALKTLKVNQDQLVEMRKKVAATYR